MATSDPVEGARSDKRGGRHREPFDERVEIDPNVPIELVVNNFRGDIDVRASDRPDVRIRADRGLRLDIEIEQEHSRIHLQTGASRTFEFGFGDLAKGIFGRGKPEPAQEFDDDVDSWERGTGPGRGSRCNVSIEVPMAAIQTEAKLRTAAGDITVEGVTGEVSAGAASGEVALRRLSGTVSAQTASGDIEIVEVEGEVRARSVSGEVQISKADLEACTVQTASGDIQIDRARLVAAGPVKIDTVSGDTSLNLGLSPDAGEQGAILEYKTVSGHARVSPPLASDGRRTWRVGAGGEGCARLTVRSVSGDLDVELALDVAESPLPPRSSRPQRPPRDDRDRRASGAASAAGVISPVPPVPPVPPIPPTPPTYPGDAERAAEDAWRVVEDAQRAAQDAAADVEAAMDDARRAIEDAEREALAAELEAREAAQDWDEADDRPEGQPDEPSVQSPRPPVEAVAEADPIRDAERLEILSALEQGEIDIDEAMRRLEPLGGDAGDVPTFDRADDR